MASKKITIFLFPDGADRVKQIKLPRFFPAFFILFIVFSVGFLFWIIQDYQAIKGQMPRLSQLQEENEQQKRQFMHLAQRIDRVTRKMGELKEFDHKLRVMMNLETSEDQEKFWGVGGSAPILVGPGSSIAKNHRELIRMMHRSLDDLDNEVALDKQEKAELHKFLENQKILLASTPSIWPTKGWLSSRFGYRISPFTGEKEFHKGIDISTRMKAPIVAPANGVVSGIGWDNGYGRLLSIKHGYGLVTRYAHLKEVLVKKGRYVKRGETIALVGDTGRSTGPHLHYEVHLNRVAVNPLRYILN